MTDVTVLGAGIFGLSVAWACLKKGARVRVIDPAGPGAGASGVPSFTHWLRISCGGRDACTYASLHDGLRSAG